MTAKQVKVDLGTWLESKGKEDKSNKVTSLSAASTDTQYPSAKCVYDELADKVEATDLATVATTGSYNDLSNKPTIPTVDSTITDGSNNAVSGNAVYDALQLKSDTGHTHTASEVLDSSAHTNIGTSANATQAAINTAIDTKIGALLSVDLLTVVQSLPAASANTMNQLYFVAEPTAKTKDNYEIFITVRTGTTGNYQYDWEKVDTARLDLSGCVMKDDVTLEIVNDELVLTLG